MTFTQGQRLYRVLDEAEANGYCDEFGELHGTTGVTIKVMLIVYTVERVTSKGAWVCQGKAGDGIRGLDRWVSDATPFVQETSQAALADARRRRRYHVKMCKQRLELAERQLVQLERDRDFGEAGG